MYPMKKGGNKKFINQNHVHAKDQARVMKKIAKKGHCPFCTNNFLLYHPKPIIKKSTYWIMSENGWPYKGSKVHFIFILKKHKEHIKSLSKNEWSELLELFKYTVRKFSIDGGSVFLRFGDTNMTGGTVNHLHAQMVSGGKRSPKKRKLKISIPLAYKK